MNEYSAWKHRRHGRRRSLRMGLSKSARRVVGDEPRGALDRDPQRAQLLVRHLVDQRLRQAQRVVHRRADDAEVRLLRVAAGAQRAPPRGAPGMVVSR